MTAPRPTLSQLRLFLAVAQAGGFGEAAADLGMSQSSVSEGVAGLERALAVRLFRRGPSGVTLTPAGERALYHAARAVLAAEDLAHAVQDQGHLAGVLRLAAPRSVASHLLPPVVAAFSSRYPGVQVRIIDAEAGGRSGEKMLQDGQADIALVHLPVNGPLMHWPFCQDEYMLAVRQGAPETGARPETGAPSHREAANWNDLTGQTLLLPPEDDRCNRLVRQYLSQHQPGLPAITITEVENDSVMLGMVAHGLGQAILPRLAALPLPDGVRLVSLPIPLFRQLGVAVLPARAGLPILAAMLPVLRRHGAAAAHPGFSTHLPGPAA